MPLEGTYESPVACSVSLRALPVRLCGTPMRFCDLRRFNGKLRGRTRFLGILPLSCFAQRPAPGGEAKSPKRSQWTPVVTMILAGAAILLAIGGKLGRSRRNHDPPHLAAKGRIVLRVVAAIAEIDLISTTLSSAEG